MSNDNAVVIALLILITPIAVVTVFLERRRKKRLPDSRPFAWGYFCGVTGLIVGIMGLAMAMAAPFTESVKKERDDLFCGGLTFFCLYGIPGFFVLKRRAWAWVFSTICCCNPIAWLINYRYGKNRWEEFRREGGTLTSANLLPVFVCVAPVVLLVALSRHHTEPSFTSSVTPVSQAAPQAKPATQSKLPNEGIVLRSNPLANGHTESASVNEQTKRATPLVIGGTAIPYHITLPAHWTTEGKQNDYDVLCSYRNTLWLGVIAEEVELETSSMADSALANMRKVCSAEPAVSEREWTTIDGRKWLSFTAETLIDGSRVTFLYHVYGGPEGTFQIVGWTTSNIFPKYQEALGAVARTFSFPGKAAGQGDLAGLRDQAEMGDAAAQFQLAFSYYTGDSVSTNAVEAVKWFRKAADQGEARAQCTLGFCYAKGNGVAQDLVEAAKWFRRAADQGEANAQSTLGGCYFFGKGVPKDYIQSYKWANLASAQGNENATELRSHLESVMTPTQISEAQRLSREFSPCAPSAPAVTPAPAEATVHSAPSATGSGFFISEDGFFITCEHVIKNAKEVRLLTRDGLIRATVVKADAPTDLALLKAKGRFAPLPLASSLGVGLGDSVVTVGFPNVGLQGFSPKLAKGEIASLSGAHDDPNYFQVSVPVQPGNSGGALVDERGNVVAVVAGKLNAAAALNASGTLPENVNYAIKSSCLLGLLESVPEVLPKIKAPNTNNNRRFQDVVKSTEDAAVLVLAY